MELVYVIDVLAALKDNGYNTNRLRKENILPESTIQKLRSGKTVSIESIGKVCELLSCQISEIVEVKK